MPRSEYKRRVGTWPIATALAAGFLPVVTLSAFLVASTYRETDGELPGTIRLIPTSLGRVAARVSGPAHGAPILLVHGSAAWSGFRRGVGARLAAGGWRVIAIDLPPFGFSERDGAVRYDRRHQAERLRAVLAVTARRFGRP